MNDKKIIEKLHEIRKNKTELKEKFFEEYEKYKYDAALFFNTITGEISDDSSDEDEMWLFEAIYEEKPKYTEVFEKYIPEYEKSEKNMDIESFLKYHSWKIYGQRNATKVYTDFWVEKVFEEKFDDTEFTLKIYLEGARLRALDEKNKIN